MAGPTLAGHAEVPPLMFPLVVGRGWLLAASSPAVGMETCLEVSSPRVASHVVEGLVAGPALRPVAEASDRGLLLRGRCRQPLLATVLEVQAVA